MSRFVLDASVAAKWCLPSINEPLADEALRLLDLARRGTLDLLVPDLFWVEMGNILRKAARVGRISASAANAGLAFIEDLGISTAATAGLVRDAMDLALSYDRTVYDSLYVILAVHRGVDLVTADERLANALAARFPVKWLGALEIM